MKSLVIVESPAKAKTLQKFLGASFEVKACGGHVRDLPSQKLGVDVEHDFTPTFTVIKGKSKIIKGLKDAAKSSATIYLAPDPDREGEAIAWHLGFLLDNSRKIKRIEFHEITKSAVEDAVKHPRSIDMKRVNAQQARRILDRLVGYKLSPLLWKKVRKGLSAGRVQSVAVKLICEREQKIREFKPEEYWSIEAYLNKDSKPFIAKYLSKEIIPNESFAKKIVDGCRNAAFIVKEVKKKELHRNPYPPFITSTLQQEAARRLNFSAKKTMIVAQQLYEGIDLKNEGHTGLITYMRTDSVRIASEAIASVRKYIEDTLGANFLPKIPNQYKTKKSAQDAHEAIRPTSVLRDPKTIKESLTDEQFKLYSLIWNRFVASQTAQAVIEQLSVDVTAGEYMFRATGSTVLFPGFLKLYADSSDEGKNKESRLPDLSVQDILNLERLEPKQHFTEPPPRYSEASLIKELEERGIGRPSTYAPILSTIVDRGYVIHENRIFKPTELGETITTLLDKHFPGIMNYEFTAHMEDELDEIVAGKSDHIAVLREFYTPFSKDLDAAYKKMETLKKDIKTEEICPECGKPIVIRSGRFGEFYACSGFPKCRFTKPIIKSLGIKCTRADCNGEILVRRTKRGKIFYSCSNYPKCKVAFWDKPTGENCPKCSNILVEKILKDKIVIKCSDKACDYKLEKQ